MASSQQPPQAGTYTNLQPAAEEDGTVETRNPLAPPLTTPTSPEELLQPPIEPDEEPDGSKFRAVVAVVRCMVGPAALYIPKGFADAGLGGGLVCVTVAMALFAFGMRDSSRRGATRAPTA